MFLHNRWYVAAWSDEVNRTLLPRTILGEDVLLYRTKYGQAVALENRCAHRRLPLSAGRLCGDEIECGYHGLAYDAAGRCTKIPGQDTPRNLGIKAFPLVERDQFVSIWIGDPALANPAQAISFPRLTDPDWGVTKVRLHIGCNYLLILDNLLDLSHVAYVHNTTIGNAPVAEDAIVSFTRHEDKVRVTRDMCSVPPSRTYAEFGCSDPLFDRWQVSEFRPPAYFLINNGSGRCGWATLDGSPRVDTQGEWGFQVYHCITPETATSSHQFWALAHDQAAVPAQGRDEFYRQCHQVVLEDQVVYEAQQRSLDSDPAGASAEHVQSRIVIEADRGLLMARRMLTELLKPAA
jgi:phenylpropionate dioxygenase-like ring-hydroxylating dioxygenase large terminal subunit